VRNYVDDYNNENQTNISFGVLGKVKYPFQLTGQILNGETFFEMIFHYCDLLEEITQKISEFYEQEGVKDIHLTTEHILTKNEQAYYKYSTRLFYNLLLVTVDRFSLGDEDFKVVVHKLFKYSLGLRLAYQTLQEKTYLNFATGNSERISKNENVCRFVLGCKNIKDLMKFNGCIDAEEIKVKNVAGGIRDYLKSGEKNEQ
jgi:hypothetical protein